MFIVKPDFWYADFDYIELIICNIIIIPAFILFLINYLSPFTIGCYDHTIYLENGFDLLSRSVIIEKKPVSKRDRKYLKDQLVGDTYTVYKSTYPDLYFEIFELKGNFQIFRISKKSLKKIDELDLYKTYKHFEAHCPYQEFDVHKDDIVAYKYSKDKMNIDVIARHNKAFIEIVYSYGTTVGFPFFNNNMKMCGKENKLEWVKNETYNAKNSIFKKEDEIDSRFEKFEKMFNNIEE
ncbi:MAG: hypothetical protein HUJ61_02530 [Bacilli bacterium]|nr:hypothetical protein [Bacilli bacterium]